MKKLIYLSCSILLVIKTFANNEKAISAKASTTQVIVYKNGAELTQKTSVNVKTGMQEIIINDVANNIDNNSIQINTSNMVTIVGIELGTEYINKQAKSSKLLQLEDSITSLNSEIEKLEINIKSNNELLDALKANKDIKGVQVGLNVLELTKFLDFYKSKSLGIHNENNELTQKINKLKVLKDVLYLQVNEERNVNNKQVGLLKLQVQVAVAGNYEFTINYLTYNAHWTPFYDIKVKDVQSPLLITTKAKIAQTTGLDWKNIKLSLSTATPSQWGNAPILSSWYLSYIDPVMWMNKQLSKEKREEMAFDKVLAGRISGVSLDESKNNTGSVANIRIRGISSLKSNNEPLCIVNGVEMSYSDFNKINSNNIKKLDVLKDANATSIYGSRAANGAIIVTLKEGMEDYINTTQNILDTQYDIDMAYTIPSNGKPQIATLTTTEAPCTYNYITIPKLETATYFIANISNWQKLNLLPGEANVVVEGTYVGKTFIDPSSVNDTFSLTLGIEKRLTVKRNKTNDFSSVKFLGSNKQQQFTYEITLKNNKQESVEVWVKDQFPLSTNKEIEIVSTDAPNASINEETGQIDWKINLAAGESKKLKFSFVLKYPKDKILNLY
jgi:TonB-dependent SusC/RagA subfamily outer membrane receptor